MSNITSQPPPSDPNQPGQSQKEFLTDLFTRHRASLLRYLIRLVRFEDAAELVQESFYRLIRHGTAVRREPIARALLFHTATNLARDLHRRRKSHHADLHTSPDFDDISTTSTGPDEQLMGEQTLDLLERAILDMPRDVREVFLLHRFHDLSYPEIAIRLNLSTRTVARKMSEALARLGEALAVDP